MPKGQVVSDGSSLIIHRARRMSITVQAALLSRDDRTFVHADAAEVADKLQYTGEGPTALYITKPST